MRWAVAETTAMRSETKEQARERFQTVTAGHFGARSTVGGSPFTAGHAMVAVSDPLKGKPAGARIPDRRK